MKLLFIDGDSALKRRVAHFFKKHGHKVHCATGARRALAVVRGVPDLGMVVTRYPAPELEARPLLEHLRADPRGKALPVIAVTSPQQKDAEKSLREGASLYLESPLDLDRLLALVSFAQ
jgi:CheY-like chemotaxis protein